MLFIAIAAVMLCVAAACVAVPLWRHRSPDAPSYETAYRSAHLNQVDELARDLAAGRLATADHVAARRDLERELALSLKAGDVGTHQYRSPGPGNHILAIAAGVILLIAMAIGYWQLGNWRVAVEGVTAASAYNIEQMAAELSHKLNTTEPNNLEGWLMLGRAYALMDRYNDAVQAFGKANKLSGDANPDILAAYAEAISLANPDQFMQKAAPLFEQVLKIDPNNEQGLWYGGLAASIRGDNKLAVQRWQTLLGENLSPQYQKQVIQYIEEAGGQAIAAPPITATAIHIYLTLDPALLNKVSPDATVFVFAESLQQSGGPPLAVRRLQVRDLPLDVTLSDADSMVAGRTLQGFPKVKVIARIAINGNPLLSHGDFEGSAVWNRSASDKLLDIDIKTKVP